MATPNQTLEDYEKLSDSVAKLNSLINKTKLAWKDVSDIVSDINKDYRELSKSAQLREQLEDKQLKNSEKLNKNPTNRSTDRQSLIYKLFANSLEYIAASMLIAICFVLFAASCHLW